MCAMPAKLRSETFFPHEVSNQRDSVSLLSHGKLLELRTGAMVWLVLETLKIDKKVGQPFQAAIIRILSKCTFRPSGEGQQRRIHDQCRKCFIC